MPHACRHEPAPLHTCTPHRGHRYDDAPPSSATHRPSKPLPLWKQDNAKLPTGPLREAQAPLHHRCTTARCTTLTNSTMSLQAEERQRGSTRLPCKMDSRSGHRNT
ncbi:hypothetical protein E2C01_068844 [Portunus trituberculatus]|uniref:Uncharacterized protein n=1 Tax=Portunus trituberculatus TaxID=210409 RepID=A0A5B7HX11_PORTR|nr:hypothetical protein [Portunus trituberculatus]